MSPWKFQPVPPRLQEGWATYINTTIIGVIGMSLRDHPHAEDEAMAEAKQVEAFRQVTQAIRDAKATGFPVAALAAEDDVKPDAVVGDKPAESANPYRLGYDIWLHAAEKMKAKHPDASEVELLRKIGQDDIAESMKALGLDKPFDQQHVIVISDGLFPPPPGVILMDCADAMKVASYEGFPVRYPDWKFGMEYEEIMPLSDMGKTIIRDMIVNKNPVVVYCLDGYNSDGTKKAEDAPKKKFPHIPFEGILAEIDGVKKVVDPHNGIEMKDDGDVVCVVDPLWDKDKKITIDHQHPKREEGVFVNAAVEKKEPVKRKFYSRLGVMDRDNYRCRFCGQDVSQDSTRNMPCRDAVICHLLVLARGGTHSYENCVTSCKVCCEKKGYMTPEEAKMPLLSLDHPMFKPSGPKNFINDGTPESEFIKDLLGVKKADSLPPPSGTDGVFVVGPQADPTELSSEGCIDRYGRPWTEKDDPRVFTMTEPLHDMEFIRAVIDAEADQPTVIVDGKVMPAGEYVAEQIAAMPEMRQYLTPTGGSPKVDQPIIIAAGNTELLELKTDKTMDALRDRTVRVEDVPYLLKWEDEIKVLQKESDRLSKTDKTPPKNQVQIDD